MTQQSRILMLDEADSTNNELRRLMEGLDNMSAVVAKKQSNGRGQGTHTWYSSPCTNLTFSLCAKFKPGDLPASDILLITCATTLGIRDYLLVKGIRPRIKWPNDIWVADRKICGILIENTLDGRFVKDSIIGIGLNVNETGWPEELPNPVSMKELTGDTYDLDAEFGILHERICRRFEMMFEDGGRDALQGEFEKNMFKLPEGQQ